MKYSPTHQLQLLFTPAENRDENRFVKQIFDSVFLCKKSPLSLQEKKKKWFSLQ
jgi:predicted component of viral defense system (DUF524 family)